MKITLKSDVKNLSKKLKRIHRKQVPFATSQALNDVAFRIRNDTVKVLWPRSVKVKQRNFARVAFRVGKSHKRNLEASVYDSLNRAFLPRQIKGGIKLPYSSTHIAIPTRNALTPTGRIKKAALLNNPRLFKAKIKRTNPGLWMRTKKGLVLMYHLQPRAQVDKAFPFYTFAERTVDLKFERYWDKRMRYAIATAR